MAKKNKEVAEEATKEPKANKTKGDITKVKAKMTQKPELMEDTITKVDLSKPPKTKEDAVQEPEANASDAVVGESSNEENSEKVVEEIRDTKEESVQNEETPVVEEVTVDGGKEDVSVEATAEAAADAIEESMNTGEPLPENVQKLMDFMEDTGGDLNDYVALNTDYSKLDSQDLLHEYYRKSKPHLNAEEINFLMEDQFSYDENTDDERSIKRKKLAQKEQVASAKSHLDGLKSKYYEDIKSGSKLTSEQQEAIDFFNRYNKEEAENKQGNEQRVNKFQEETKNVFNDKFKGFEYNVGEKKFRYNVQDAKKVGENQSDISNFIGKFLDENNTMKDAEGYHKSIFTANNADAIARHFYEQGKSDAIKQSVEKGKNISMEPRQAHGEVQAGGIKVKALGDNTADFKFKIKNK